MIGQFSGQELSVIPTGIISDVNAQLVKREYRRKCESTSDLNTSNDLKLDETVSLKVFTFSYAI